MTISSILYIFAKISFKEYKHKILFFHLPQSNQKRTVFAVLFYFILKFITTPFAYRRDPLRAQAYIRATSPNRGIFHREDRS